MAGKIKPMSQIKQLLLLQQQGQKIKAIARNLGISKNTVKSYLARIIVMNKPIEELLSMDDPSLASIFHGGNPACFYRFNYVPLFRVKSVPPNGS